MWNSSLVLHSSQGLAWRARAGSFVLSILKMRRQPCLPASLLVLFKQRRVCSSVSSNTPILESDDERDLHIFRRQHFGQPTLDHVEGVSPSRRSRRKVHQSPPLVLRCVRSRSIFAPQVIVPSVSSDSLEKQHICRRHAFLLLLVLPFEKYIGAISKLLGRYLLQLKFSSFQTHWMEHMTSFSCQE